MRVAFLGPPGAGKGTQARFASHALGIPHISTGDLLRSTVRKGTKIGKQAEGYMSAGQLVPDAIVLTILKERLKERDAWSGFILDGFPRNVEQEGALSEIFPLDLVIYFDIGLEALLARLTERRVCPKCERVYNLVTQPPRESSRCDEDGATLMHRADDRREAIATRFEVFQKETTPLLQLYRRKGILRVVLAGGRVEATREAVKAAMS